MREVKAIVSGSEYLQRQIQYCKITRGLFSAPTLSIGGCVSAEMEITLISPGEIPRSAEIKIYCREDGGEWIPQGVFYVDQRSESIVQRTITLKCYDSMLMTEQTWIDDGMSGWDWPASPRNVVENICTRLGITLDSRTSLNESFTVEYPVDEYGDMTMREVLSYIAMANAGNWIITGSGALYLARIAEMPPETSYLVDKDGSVILFGEVRLIV